MKKNDNIRDIAVAAMLLATAFVLPFFTGQLPRIGAMLCPMHIPVILCGYVCGKYYGMTVGFVAPLLRSAIMGMPVMFPAAIAMAVELAVYGFMSGFLYRRLPGKKVSIYISLVASMLIGRFVWGGVQFALMGFDSAKFGFSAFVAGAFVNALPGIAVQLVLIPVLVMAVEGGKIFRKQ